MRDNLEVKQEIERHLTTIMELLDIPITQSNFDTPRRVAKMWADELFANRNDRNIEELKASMKLFPNEYDNELVVIRDIDFNSMCEHHWLPFSGKVTVAYVPRESVIGLSKIPRVVRYFSKRPTLQESLCKDICDFLFDTIDPLMVVVYIKSTHSCVKCRGAESDCETLSTYSRHHIPQDLGMTKEWAEFLTKTREYIDQRVGVI